MLCSFAFFVFLFSFLCIFVTQKVPLIARISSLSSLSRNNFALVFSFGFRVSFCKRKIEKEKIHKYNREEKLDPVQTPHWVYSNQTKQMKRKNGGKRRRSWTIWCQFIKQTVKGMKNDVAFSFSLKKMMMLFCFFFHYFVFNWFNNCPGGWNCTQKNDIC